MQTATDDVLGDFAATLVDDVLARCATESGTASSHRTATLPRRLAQRRVRHGAVHPDRLRGRRRVHGVHLLTSGCMAVPERARVRVARQSSSSLSASVMPMM